MSRIGRQPIPVPAGVMVSIEPNLVTVNGPKGELSERIPREITVRADGNEFTVTVRIDTPNEQRYYRHGGILQLVLRELLP